MTIKSIIFKIFNYNDVDYIVKGENEDYKFYFEENDELKELLDDNVLAKLTTLLKLAMR